MPGLAPDRDARLRWRLAQFLHRLVNAMFPGFLKPLRRPWPQDTDPHDRWGR